MRREGGKTQVVEGRHGRNMPRQHEMFWTSLLKMKKDLKGESLHGDVIKPIQNRCTCQAEKIFVWMECPWTGLYNNTEQGAGGVRCGPNPRVWSVFEEGNVGRREATREVKGGREACS